jgi:hypothetical protein
MKLLSLFNFQKYLSGEQLRHEVDPLSILYQFFIWFWLEIVKQVALFVLLEKGIESDKKYLAFLH